MVSLPVISKDNKVALSLYTVFYPTHQEVDVPGIEVVQAWHMSPHVLQNPYQTIDTAPGEGRRERRKT